jgi:hypothetical protein
VTVEINFAGTLEEVGKLTDEQFVQEWKYRYDMQRAAMVPDIARWLRLLRFFHPQRLEDHWQDQFGNPLPKLYKSEGLSVEIYNWCRPIIEVYGSLLAGQKPMPFIIDVPTDSPDDEVERFRADAQEKLLTHELHRQKIPLHFLDFCTSVVLFGIGYVCSWIDPRTGKLRTQSLPWPGDVLPQWGSDRHGSGSDGMESVIISERVNLDTARRLYGDKFVRGDGTPSLSLDGSTALTESPVGSTLLLKIWWRHEVKGKEKVGYAVVAHDPVKEGENAVLYRKDESGYPEIPIKWAARFNTPTEPPHRSAGVLDDIVGINTEYNEKMCAMADMIMKLVYTKYVAKGFTPSNVPRLSRDSNMYAIGLQQEIKELEEKVNNFPFDGFLARLETMMFTVSGLSRLMMGSMPPGDTSGEALSNLLHAAIGRLEGVRTPIQWAWTGLFDEIWVPLMRDNYKIDVGGKKQDLKALFTNYSRTSFIWPDVTPRDQLRAIELAMNLNKSKLLSRQGAQQRSSIPSVIDEEQRLREELQDVVMNPEDVQKTAMAQQAQIMVKQAQMMLQQQAMGMMAGQPGTPGAAGDAQNKKNDQMEDTTRKADANKTPKKDESNNSPVVGSEENAAQGYNNGQG